MLSARGPLHGVPQMVLGRMAFGFKGNAVPAVLMSVTAGVGWFATNSVSGAFALGSGRRLGTEFSDAPEGARQAVPTKKSRSPL